MIYFDRAEEDRKVVLDYLSIKNKSNLNENMLNYLDDFILEQKFLTEDCRGYSHINESAQDLSDFLADYISAIKEKLMELYAKYISDYNIVNLKYITFIKRYEKIIFNENKYKLPPYTTYTYPGYAKTPIILNMESYIDLLDDLKVDTNTIEAKVNAILAQFGDDLINDKGFKFIELDAFRSFAESKMTGSRKILQPKNKEDLKQIMDEIYYQGFSNASKANQYLKDFEKKMKLSMDNTKKTLEKKKVILKNRNGSVGDFKYRNIEGMGPESYTDLNYNMLEINRLYTNMVNMVEIAYTTKISIMEKRITTAKQYMNTLIQDERVAGIYIDETFSRAKLAANPNNKVIG